MYKHLDLFKDLVSAFSTMSQVNYHQCCTVIASVPLADTQLNDLLLFCPNTDECEERMPARLVR